MPIQTEYMQEFAAKHNLPAVGGVKLVGTGNTSYLRIQNPIVLARFVSFVKAREAQHGAEVFLRGQSDDFPGMIPGLFRGNPTSAQKNARWVAYLAVIETLPSEFNLGRLRRTNLGALLQHYGLRTPWLDVVDNMYVAVWFARHIPNMRNGSVGYRRRNKGQGWVYLISTRADSRPDLAKVDLRTQHSSLSVRPHVQHGLSLARQIDGVASRNGSDLQRYIVGRVEFNLQQCWFMSGEFAKVDYMFPSPQFDHTAQVLASPRANAIVHDAEQQFALPVGSLGRFYTHA